MTHQRTTEMRRKLFPVAAALALLISGTAGATIVIDHSNTVADGLPTQVPLVDNHAGYTGQVSIGQLAVAQAGFIQFEYLGNLANYTNELRLYAGSTLVFSTAGLPDNVWTDPGTFSGWFGVGPGYLPFSLCTDGGSMHGDFGGCVDNADSDSISAQWFLSGTGYRSVAYREEADGSWLIFWDDSGYFNDDDYDDLVARVYYKVPEPGTLALLGFGLMGLGFASRRRKA